MIDIKKDLDEQNNISLYIVNDDTGEVLKQRTINYNENRQDEIKSKLIGKKKLRIYSRQGKSKTRYDSKYGEEYLSLYTEYRYMDSIDTKIYETNASLYKLFKQLSLNANRVTNVVKTSYKFHAKNWTDIYNLLNIKHHQKLRNDFVKFSLENKLIKVIDFSETEKMFILNPFYFKRSKYCHLYTLYHFLDVANELGVFSRELNKYIRVYVNKRTIFMRQALENVEDEVSDIKIDKAQELENDSNDTNIFLNEL